MGTSHRLASLLSSNDRRKAELERHKLPVPTPPVKARPAEGGAHQRRPGVALGVAQGVASSKWIRPMHSVARCRPRRIRPIAYPDTFCSQDDYSGSGIRANAGLAQGQPRRAGPDVKRPRAAPGAALSGAGLASALGGEVLAKKAAVILPKPRVTPVQQPAVKHEEAVRAQNNSSKERGSSACAEANSE